jgi:3-dehydroquinate dehydratase
MTLQELKDKKNVFSNISNEELIQIFNKVLNPKPDINSMNHDLSKKSIDRVLYSNIYIDWFINKVKSYHTFSKTPRHNLLRYS